MSRPSTLTRGSTQYWTLMVYNTSGVLVDADSTPTVAVRKNGASVADVVTVTKRAATTGIYDCSYNPAGELSTDIFEIEETATVSAQAYTNTWAFRVMEDMPQGFGSVSVDTNTGSIGADLLAVFTEPLVPTSGINSNMADRLTDFLDHGSAAGRTSGNFNTVAPVDVSADVTAILADTNELQLNQGNWLTATGFNTVAPDNASITAILADTNELQTNQGNWLTATGFNTVAPDNASITAILADTNELQLNQGNWVTATGFATPADCSTDAEVYAYFTALTRADSFKADVSALATSAALATVDANVDLVLADTSELQTNQGQWLTATGFATSADIAGLNDPTAAAIADAVWDEAQGGHVTAGTFGAYLDSAVSAAGGGGLTAAAIADAVWDELSSEHIVLGSFGAYIDAAISTVSSSGSGLYQVSVRIQDAALNALQGAYVSIDGTTITLVTDPTGEVTFNLDNGNYTLTVLPPAGYTMPANQGVTVSSADPAQTVFTLSATAASGCDVTWVG